MSIDLTHFLTVAYGVMGFVAVAGYGPQVLAFYKDPLVCARTPLATWIMWTLQTIVFHAYAWGVNGDPMFIATTGMFMLCTIGCLALLLRGRQKAATKVLGGARNNVVPLNRKVA